MRIQRLRDVELGFRCLLDARLTIARFVVRARVDVCLMLVRCFVDPRLCAWCSFGARSLLVR